MEVIEITDANSEDYSPSYMAGASVNYLYNGKEMDRMHGLNMLDYGARWKDLDWITVDPLCEKYFNNSPYAYCANNPVRFVDSDGMEWKPTRNHNTGEQRGYKWVTEDQSYNKNGFLKTGLYAQAIFFSDNGTYDSNSSFNLGSSTAYVFSRWKNEYIGCMYTPF